LPNNSSHCKRGKAVCNDASNEHQMVDIIPRGLELLVSEGKSIKLDQPLTSNPNVGGFGQGNAKIVLQKSID
jgi:apocytochrome f